MNGTRPEPIESLNNKQEHRDHYCQPRIHTFPIVEERIRYKRNTKLEDSTPEVIDQHWTSDRERTYYKDRVEISDVTNSMY